MDYVYLVGVVDGLYKIGFSVDPLGRLNTLQCGCPLPLAIVHQIETVNGQWLESIVHRVFEKVRCSGEWFRLSDADVDNLKRVASVDGVQDIPDWMRVELADAAATVIVDPPAVPKKRRPVKTKQSSFRLSEETATALSAIADDMSATSYQQATNADALRYALQATRRSLFPVVGEIGDNYCHQFSSVESCQGSPSSTVSGCVCYKVRGDSMNDELIGDGDYVVVLPCDDAANGATVAYHLADNGCVIKRFDKAKGQLFSGTGKGRWIHKLREDDKFLGVYVGLIRRV